MTTGTQDSNGFPGSLATKATPVDADSVEIIDSADSNKPKKATLGSLPFLQPADLPLSLSDGGTNKSLTADNGGVVYSDADSFEILAHTTTANQALLSGNASAPSWSTATYPVTTTINRILYSSAANTISELATANSGMLATTSAGVPIMLGPMTNGQIVIGSSGATPVVGSITAGSGVTVTPSAGGIQISATGSGGTVTAVTASAPLASSGGATPDISFTGVLGLANGGTAKALTADNGGIVYSDADSFEILAHTTTAGQMLRSGNAVAPTWSTTTWPATTTINRLLWSSAANVISDLATANSGLLVTDGSGVPSIATAIPNGVTATTQSSGDNSTKVATTAYADAVAGTGGGLVKIATVNTTAATVDFANNLTSSYDDYIVVVKYAVPATNAVTWHMRVGTGAGPTYQSTNYAATGCIANTGSAGGQTSGTATLDLCTISRWSNTSTTGAGGHIMVNNVNSSSNNKTVTSLLTYKDSTGAQEFGFFMPGQWQGATVLTSLRFLTSSGNITLTATLYGLQK